MVNGFVLFLTFGLAWERYRGLAVTLLHVLLFVFILYGVLFGVVRYGKTAEPRRRKGIILFTLVSLLLLPPLYIPIRPELLAPFIHWSWYDPLAFPLFQLLLALSSLPFFQKRRW